MSQVSHSSLLACRESSGTPFSFCGMNSGTGSFCPNVNTLMNPLQRITMSSCHLVDPVSTATTCPMSSGYGTNFLEQTNFQDIPVNASTGDRTMLNDLQVNQENPSSGRIPVQIPFPPMSSSLNPGFPFGFLTISPYGYSYPGMSCLPGACQATSVLSAPSSNLLSNNDADDGEWRVIGKRRRVPKPQVGRPDVVEKDIPFELVEDVLRRNRDLELTLSGRDYLMYKDKDFFQFFKSVQNNVTQRGRLELKVTPVKGEEELDEIYNRFKREFLAPMNKMREDFKKYPFKDGEQAIYALSAVLRTYVAGFTVHVKEIKKKGEVITSIRLQCHTQWHTKKTVEARNAECNWKATITHKNDGYFYFTQIDDFAIHRKECFRAHARFNKYEVQEQHKLSREMRAQVAKELNQNLVSGNTLDHKSYMAKRKYSGDHQRKLKESSMEETEDESISNRKQLGVEVGDNMKKVLLYLSSLHRKNDVDCFVHFKLNVKRPEVVTICLMWPIMKKFLSSHADVIFCDSIWNISFGGYHLLTIVILDDNFRLRLAAMCIVKEETGETWKEFFSFVKQRVPSFNPQCVISDGAAYIRSAFRDVMGSSATYIICWWHRRKNLSFKQGYEWELSRAMLSLSYASNDREIRVLSLKALLIGAKMKKKDSNVIEKIKESTKTAFIKMKLFCGGTLTNSYSESVNSLLRNAGLKPPNSIYQSLCNLTSFCETRSNSFRLPFPFKANKAVDAILSHDVTHTLTNGALNTFQDDVRKAQATCSCTRSPLNDRIFFVREKVTMVNEFGVKLRKYVKWRVDWNDEVPNCTCNGATYRGLPCKHIAITARPANRRIPLACFNRRFYVQPGGNDVDSLFYLRNGNHQIDDHVQEQVQVQDDGCCDEELENEHLQEQEQVQDDGCWDGQHENDPDLEEDDVYSEGQVFIDDGTELDVDQDEVQPEVDADQDVAACCRRRRPQHNSIMQLSNSDEIVFYSQLVSSAYKLVEVRGVPSFEQRADALLEEFSGFLLCFEMTLPNIQAEYKEVSPSVRFSVQVISDEQTQAISDHLHITGASINALNPSKVMCAFRGKLDAIIIRALTIRRVDPRKATFFADWYHRVIKGLAEACSSLQKNQLADFADCQGRLNSRSYKAVPRKVARFAVIELNKITETIAVNSASSPSVARSGTDAFGSQQRSSKRRRRS